MRKAKVGVLMGGWSSEQAVSLETGRAVLAALARLGYPAQSVFVDRHVDLVLRQSNIEVAFVALRGKYGEDGCIQGLLETMGIPYTGSDVLASALAMHKVKSKELFRLHNLPTPAYYVLSRIDLPHARARHGDFGFPVVVKPVAAGSSLGVAVARYPDELSSACEEALFFDDEILIERFVAGQEISVAVLGGRALGAAEIEPDGELFAYGAKSSGSAARYHLPPRTSPERYRGLLTQAERAHRVLGCRGATCVDLILSASGNETILEVNTLPALTPASLLPRVAAQAGLTSEDLVQAIVQGARLAAWGRGDRRVSQRQFEGSDRRNQVANFH